MLWKHKDYRTDTSEVDRYTPSLPSSLLPSLPSTCASSLFPRPKGQAVSAHSTSFSRSLSLPLPLPRCAVRAGWWCRSCAPSGTTTTGSTTTSCRTARLRWRYVHNPLSLLPSLTVCLPPSVPPSLPPTPCLVSHGEPPGSSNGGGASPTHPGHVGACLMPAVQSSLTFSWVNPSPCLTHAVPSPLTFGWVTATRARLVRERHRPRRLSTAHSLNLPSPPPSPSLLPSVPSCPAGQADRHPLCGQSGAGRPGSGLGGPPPVRHHPPLQPEGGHRVGRGGGREGWRKSFFTSCLLYARDSSSSFLPSLPPSIPPSQGCLPPCISTSSAPASTPAWTACSTGSRKWTPTLALQVRLLPSLPPPFPHPGI